MGMSQMCTGAGDYFRTSKPHSEKLCHTSNKEKALLNIVNINWNWRTLTYSLQKLHRQSLLSDKFLDLNTRIHQPPYQCPFHASDIERYSR